MPPPIKTNIENALLPYQFHQVAIFCPRGTPLSAATAPYEDLGYDNWIEDRAVLVGAFRMPNSSEAPENWVNSKVEAHMLFNYDSMPMELEFLKYYSGVHRHRDRVNELSPFISHMSTYVDDVVEEIGRMRPLFGLPYHRFVTTEHTNPNVVGKKRFIEAIFNTREVLGYDLKLIQKVALDYDDTKYLNHSIWS